VTVSASSVVVGDCVTVTGSSSKSTITASSVTVSQPTSGKCSAVGAGGRFGGGAAGSFAGGGFTRPSGGFTRPSGAPGAGAHAFPGAGNFGFASGQVTKASSTSLTISGFSSAGLKTTAKTIAKSKKSSKIAKTPAIKTTKVKVKLTASTIYTETQPAAASTLTVGDCVTAAGTTTSTGAVTAATVRITSTGGKTCTAGFGGFGGGAASG
jgi:hypothetical protein